MGSFKVMTGRFKRKVARMLSDFLTGMNFNKITKYTRRMEMQEVRGLYPMNHYYLLF